jgi:hypothetical protein
MNYVDPSGVEIQHLKLNTSRDGLGVAEDAIAWTITREGDDDVTEAFTTPSDYFSISDMGYWQRLSVDFLGAGIQLKNETQYTLEAVYLGEVVYRGKLYTTQKDIQAFSINEGTFTNVVSKNNFIILD